MITKKNITEDISIFIVKDINVYHNSISVKLLENLYHELFLNRNVFLSFRRVEDLTDDSMLNDLKVYIYQMFKKHGKYQVVRPIDETRFDSIAEIYNYNFNIHFMIDLWMYFYSCLYFIPKKHFSFEDYESFQISSNFRDKFSVSLLSSDYTDFTCIKDTGGENLIISCKDYIINEIEMKIEKALENTLKHLPR